MSQQIQEIDVNTATVREFEKWWWQSFNEKCLKCEKNCKQSWRVGLSCPNFKSVQS